MPVQLKDVRWTLLLSYVADKNQLFVTEQKKLLINLKCSTYLVVGIYILLQQNCAKNNTKSIKVQNSKKKPQNIFRIKS